MGSERCVDAQATAVMVAAGQGAEQHATKKDLTPLAFSFPLNVYALLLQLEEGEARYLHYGLFEHAQMTAGEAQQRASERLWQQLPPPCRLLDVGLGLGTSLARLSAEGYAALGISPDAAQLDWVRARHGHQLAMRCCRFEDFDELPGQWQAMLFQESSQYIDLLELFAGAQRLLSVHGELLIMDEFRLRRTAGQAGGLHELAQLRTLAGRFGFEVVCCEDLSQAAAGTVDWLLAACERQQAQLLLQLAPLGVDEARLAQLQAANREYRQRYASGEYGYFLLRLRRVREPHWWPARLRAADAPAMRELFAEVFGQPLTAAHWQWKYGEGRGLAVAVWQATVVQGARPRLVAHFGGLRRALSYRGQQVVGLQCVDVMVAPEGRASLSRHGPLFLATASCLELELGHGRPQLLGFGFPNRRAFRLPERLGLYAAVGYMLEVRWPLLRAHPSLRLTLRPLTLTQTAAGQRQLAAAAAATINACWQAMQASLADYIVGVRDAAHVEHRYVQHPQFDYQLFELRPRWRGAALGVLVLRRHEEAGGMWCELVDVIAPLAHWPQLVRQARRLAARMGATALRGWFSDGLLRALAGGGFQPGQVLAAPPLGASELLTLDISIPANVWSPGPAPDEQRGRWWLMAGDTDFR